MKIQREVTRLLSEIHFARFPVAFQALDLTPYSLLIIMKNDAHFFIKTNTFHSEKAKNAYSIFEKLTPIIISVQEKKLSVSVPHYFFFEDLICIYIILIHINDEFSKFTLT